MSSEENLVSFDLIFGAVSLVLALVIPILFHLVHLGSTFLPMFFPIALCGMFVSVPVAIIVGFCAPLISGLLTGMPPFFPPIAPMMALEGMILGGTIAYFRSGLQWSIISSLILGILLQRIFLLMAVYILAPLFHLPGEIFCVAMVLSGIPGVILQIIAIPPLVYVIEPRINRIRDVE